MDPYGHEVASLYRSYLDKGLDVRPTIAITRASMRVAEIAEAVKNGVLPVDGQIVMTQQGDVRVTKVAVEPVWHLPGVAERFNIDEGKLRRALFEHTGGMYPELITRPDLDVFLPPIGGLTVYIFGPPERVSDPNVKLACRVHDECNGSDVFQSDICTCRPYLAFGIQEAIREAQNGGSGICIYFRKEGRALGEVVKYLVYNSRKRGGDTADLYFTRTENIAGVRDVSKPLRILIHSLALENQLIKDPPDALSRTHAGYTALARCNENRSHALHVEYETRRDSQFWHPHSGKNTHPRR